MISDSRIKHILKVAIKMKKYVAENPGKYSCTPDEAFLIGYLHDIGYEYTDIQTEHCYKGGEVLRDQGYKYWQEIYYHGVPQEVYISPELTLLNYVDMTTSPNGEDITLQQRIDDIAVRYGKDSVQVKDAKKVIELIHKAGM